MMYQYLYFATRNPDFTLSQFINRWRRHAILAATERPFWDPIRYYVQNDVLADVHDPVLPRTAFDGYAEFEYENVEAKPAASVALTADGEEFFGPQPLRRFGGEQTLIAGVPDRPYRLTLLVPRLADGAEATLVDTVTDLAANLDCRGVACSLSIKPDFDYDAMITVWVEEHDDIARLYSSPGYRALAEAMIDVAPTESPMSVAGRELPLFGQRHLA